MAYEVRCADAGAVCRQRIKAPSKDELRDEVVKHLQKRHRVDSPTETVMDHLLAAAKER